MNTAQLIFDDCQMSRGILKTEIAETIEQKIEGFRLRYQVYSLERGFEPGQNGLETDDHDCHSRHVLLRHTPTDKVIGTVRLVTLPVWDPAASLPMEQVCRPFRLAQLPRHQVAEVSRFALSKALRSLVGEQSNRARLELIRGIVLLSRRIGIRYWYALMEPKLLRLLQHSAIHFHQAGAVVEHHGTRQPSMVDLPEMLARVRREQPDTWQFLTGEGGLAEENEEALAAA